MLQRAEEKPVSPCARCGAASSCSAWSSRLCGPCMAAWFKAAESWPRDTSAWAERTKAWIAEIGRNSDTTPIRPISRVA